MVWPPSLTGFSENDLVKPSVGPSEGIPIATLAFPLFPASEVRSPETMLNGPSAKRVTPTLAEQLALAPTDPPVKVIVFPPSVALKVPPQSLRGLAGSLRATPAGRFKMNPRLLTAVPLLFWTSKVSSAQLPIPTASGDKLIEKLGAWARAAAESSNGATNILKKNELKRRRGREWLAFIELSGLE